MNLVEIHNRWLAVQVNVGRELVAAAGIRLRGYECFLPLYEKRHYSTDRIKQAPLIPGYIFVRFDAHNVNTLVKVPGVIRFVCMGHHPAPVQDYEIEALQIVTRARRRCGP